MKDKTENVSLPVCCHSAYYQPPGARTEKVARLRDAVGLGVYRVEARKVAQALLKEHLINQMIMQVISGKVNYGRIAPGENN